MINANALAQHAAKLAAGEGLKAPSPVTPIALLATDIGAAVTGPGFFEIGGANLGQLRAGGTAFSAEAWVKVPQYLTNDASAYEVFSIVGTGDRYLDSLSWSFIIYHNAYHPVLYFAVNQTAMLSNVDMRNYEGQWVHVAVTWDGANNTLPKLYFNGVLDVSTPYFSRTGDSGFPTTSSATAIGAMKYNGNWGNNHSEMILDEVRVWFTERTAQQIIDNKDVALAGNEAGLKTYFRFNGDLLDSSTLANSATPYAGAVLDEAQDALILVEDDVVPLVVLSNREIVKPKGPAAESQSNVDLVVGATGGRAVKIVLVAHNTNQVLWETRSGLPLGSTTGHAVFVMQYNDGAAKTLKAEVGVAEMNAATNGEVVLGTIPAGSSIKNITFVKSNEFNGAPSYQYLATYAKA
jgi:hypothetical protein